MSKLSKVEKMREFRRKYKKSEKGKLAEKKYVQSKKGKATNLRKTLKYKNSENGKNILETYYASEKYLNCSKNKCAKRRAAKLQRTPYWADLNKIKEVYLNCPKGYHVDHVIPLQGKNISGLHVETNLQYLTPSENSSKSNKF